MKEPKTLVILRRRKGELERSLEKLYAATHRNYPMIHHTRKTLALTDILIKELEKELEKAQKIQAYQKPRWEIL